MATSIPEDLDEAEGLFAWRLVIDDPENQRFMAQKVGTVLAVEATTKEGLLKSIQAYHSTQARFKTEDLSGHDLHPYGSAA
jgi:hypothetical protein